MHLNYTLFVCYGNFIALSLILIARNAVLCAWKSEREMLQVKDSASEKSRGKMKEREREMEKAKGSAEAIHSDLV